MRGCNFCRGEKDMWGKSAFEQHAYIQMFGGNVLDVYTTHEEEWSDDEYTTGQGEFVINYCPMCGSEVNPNVE